jgi:FixJ family two-component response regulator
MTTTMCEPTVFVVDDDVSVLRSIARLLRLNDLATKTYDCPWTFLREIDAASSGCLLLDLSLRDVSGLEVQDQLVAARCSLPVVFLTAYGTVQSSVRAMKAGAFDFIEKPFENAVLLGAVHRALERDRAARASRSSNALISGRLALLTPREAQVLRHVIAGMLNKQIAARLGTAEKTVKVHRARVMQKMSVRSVAELTRAALVAGLQPER